MWIMLKFNGEEYSLIKHATYSKIIFGEYDRLKFDYMKMMLYHDILRGAQITYFDSKIPVGINCKSNITELPALKNLEEIIRTIIRSEK